MYICLCNPFTDKDLDGVLKDENIAKRTADVYKACTGGEKPCCGSCICEVQDRLDRHNEETVLMAAE